MLGNVLPGLRELRAPLAAGYLWLLFAWMVWGDTLPTKDENKGDALDRLYQLEPVISSIGLAVVASVAAYVLGSIVIDVQTAIGRRIANLESWYWMRFSGADPDEYERVRAGHLSLTDAGRRMLERWELARAVELQEVMEHEARQAQADAVSATVARDAVKRDVDEMQKRALAQGAGRAFGSSADAAVLKELREWQARLDERELAVATASYLEEALKFRPDRDVSQATAEYITSNRDLLKTRLLDTSAPLHSDLDRPDAEATFRMALWVPLTALVIYLTVKVSLWWVFALVVPVLLAWQWISLRRQANAALVAAFVARDELGGQVAKAEVRKGTVRSITEHLSEMNERNPNYWPPRYLLEYPQRPTPAPQALVEQRVPDGGARAPDGQPKQPDESKQSDEPHAPEPQPGEPEPLADHPHE